jgi:hypothetical protein
MKSCIVTGCTNKYRSIGLCSSHWKVFKKYGSATPVCFCGELSHTNAGNRGGTLLCKTHALLERFWENVDVKGEEDCWLWNGSKTAAGYGVIYWSSDNTYAHRISIELDGRVIPARFHACHTCDNPPCVNPKHLFVGSPRDNMLDKVAKNRHTYGETHPAAKLTDKEVEQIRGLFKDGVWQTDLAKTFNVHQSHISRIVYGLIRRN